jgi:hypothetical protein
MNTSGDFKHTENKITDPTHYMDLIRFYLEGQCNFFDTYRGCELYPVQILPHNQIEFRKILCRYVLSITDKTKALYGLSVANEPCRYD